MGKMIYTAIISLDGYHEDADGRFDWAAPDEEVHEFINDLERSVGIYGYGRRMYEVMSVWESDDKLGEQSPATREFARIWRAADKIVYSTTLRSVSTKRTHLEHRFDPAHVRRMKEESEADISVAGPDLAAHAFRSGLVDECRLFLAPVLVGDGKPALPPAVRLDLDLTDERRFKGGMVYLGYAVRS
jgi:dihydrofolate reductase